VRVLVLGASRYYAKSIARLRSEGFYTIAVDRNPAALGQVEADEFQACDIIDDAAIVEVAFKSKVDLILPLNDYGVPTAARASEKLGLPSISTIASDAATNKEIMRKMWSSRGLPCPMFRIESDLESIVTAIDEIGLPVILKPAHGIGGGSRGVVVVTRRAEIPDAIEECQAYYDDKSILVEQFIPGLSEHSAEFLVTAGQSKLIVVGDKQKTALPYRVDKSVIYPTSLNHEQRRQVQEIGSRAIEALGIDRGTAHLEFSWTGNSLMLFELGARCGGGATPEPIVRYLTGVNLIAEQAKAIANLPSCPVPSAERRSCVYRFLTPAAGEVKSIRGWNEILKNPTVLDAHLEVRVGDIVRPVRCGGDRAGYLVVAGTTREDALAKADELEKQLEIEYVD